MARQSLILLGSTQGLVNYTGPKSKAAGYFGSGRNIHTIAVYLQDFTGRLYVDGTLASDPEENDWFSINLNGLMDYVQYPNHPDNHVGPNGDTKVDTFTFDGNFVFLRARIDRSYLNDPTDPDNGYIEKILLNY